MGIALIMVLALIVVFFQFVVNGENVLTKKLNRLGDPFVAGKTYLGKKVTISLHPSYFVILCYFHLIN